LWCCVTLTGVCAMDVVFKVIHMQTVMANNPQTWNLPRVFMLFIGGM
jgi:hypothetical protein